MITRRSALVGLCIGLALLHGCRRQRESPLDLILTNEVSPQPPRVGRTTTITVKLTDSSGNPITRAQVTLEGNMTHAGMVPVYAETVEFQPGRYQANIELTMAGDWTITVHVKLTNGLNVERQFEIKGVLT